MTKVGVFVDCASKALIAVAVMISVVVLVGNPPLDTPARSLAALLLALGTMGLVALRLPAVRTLDRR